MKARGAVFVVAVVAMAVSLPTAAAVDVPVSGTGPLSAPDGPAVTIDTEGGTEINFDELFSNGEVRLNTSDGIVEFRSSGPTEATIATGNMTGSWTNVTQINATKYNLTIDPGDKQKFTVGGDLERIGVKKSVTLGDGVVDFRYGGASGSSNITLNNVPADTDLTAVDADTGEILGGARSDSIGTVTFTDLPNSDHNVKLEENEFAPSIDNASMSPDGDSIPWRNETLSVDVDDSDFPNDELTVEFYVNGSKVGEDTLTSAGTASASVDGLSESDHDWYAVATDNADQSTTSATKTFTVDHLDPQISDESPLGDIDFNPSELSVNVSDGDFGKDGDSLTVDFQLDGNDVGSDTLASNGTASTSISDPVGGPHDVTVTVTDSYGQTVTEDYTFSVPSNVTVFNESNPDQIVTNVDVTVRFFGDEETFDRSTGSNGVVNMTGLPVAQPFVVRAQPPDSSDYGSRRIYIDSIYQQQEIYLLNENVTETNELTFNIEDETGQFARGGTVLEISRPLEKDFDGDGNQTTEYQRISGDLLDANGEFPATLESGVRYRLRVKSTDGDVRELGAITPRTDRLYNLRIQGLTGNASRTEDGLLINTSQNITDTNSGPVKGVRFTVQDNTSETTKIQLTVHEAGNASNVFDTTTLTNEDGISSYTYTQLFSDEGVNTSLVANYTVIRDGEAVRGVQSFGTQQYEVANDLSDDWGSIFGVGFLLVLGGLFSVANARIGALIVPGAAMVLYITGIISPVASAAAIGLAFALAVGINVVRTSGTVLQR